LIEVGAEIWKEPAINQSINQSINQFM